MKSEGLSLNGSCTPLRLYGSTGTTITSKEEKTYFSSAVRNKSVHAVVLDVKEYFLNEVIALNYSIAKSKEFIKVAKNVLLSGLDMQSELSSPRTNSECSDIKDNQAALAARKLKNTIPMMTRANLIIDDDQMGVKNKLPPPSLEDLALIRKSSEQYRHIFDWLSRISEAITNQNTKIIKQEKANLAAYRAFNIIKDLINKKVAESHSKYKSEIAEGLLGYLNNYNKSDPFKHANRSLNYAVYMGEYINEFETEFDKLKTVPSLIIKLKHWIRETFLNEKYNLLENDAESKNEVMVDKAAHLLNFKDASDLIFNILGNYNSNYLTDEFIDMFFDVLREVNPEDRSNKLNKIANGVLKNEVYDTNPNEDTVEFSEGYGFMLESAMYFSSSETSESWEVKDKHVNSKEKSIDLDQEKSVVMGKELPIDMMLNDLAKIMEKLDPADISELKKFMKTSLKQHIPHKSSDVNKIIEFFELYILDCIVTSSDVKISDIIELMRQKIGRSGRIEYNPTTKDLTILFQQHNFKQRLEKALNTIRIVLNSEQYYANTGKFGGWFTPDYRSKEVKENPNIDSDFYNMLVSDLDLMRSIKNICIPTGEGDFAKFVRKNASYQTTSVKAVEASLESMITKEYFGAGYNALKVVSATLRSQGEQELVPCSAPGMIINFGSDYTSQSQNTPDSLHFSGSVSKSENSVHDEIRDANGKAGHIEMKDISVVEIPPRPETKSIAKFLEEHKRTNNCDIKNLCNVLSLLKIVSEKDFIQSDLYSLSVVLYNITKNPQDKSLFNVAYALIDNLNAHNNTDEVLKNCLGGMFHEIDSNGIVWWIDTEGVSGTVIPYKFSYGQKLYFDYEFSYYLVEQDGDLKPMFEFAECILENKEYLFYKNTLYRILQDLPCIVINELGTSFLYDYEDKEIKTLKTICY